MYVSLSLNPFAFSKEENVVITGCGGGNTGFWSLQPYRAVIQPTTDLEGNEFTICGVHVSLQPSVKILSPLALWAMVVPSRNPAGEHPSLLWVTLSAQYCLWTQVSVVLPETAFGGKTVCARNLSIGRAWRREKSWLEVPETLGLLPFSLSLKHGRSCKLLSLPWIDSSSQPSVWAAQNNINTTSIRKGPALLYMEKKLQKKSSQHHIIDFKVSLMHWLALPALLDSGPSPMGIIY